MAGNGQEVVDHRAFHAVGGQLGFVGDLGIVLVEVFRELNNRLLDELEITDTADDDTQLDGLVGLDLGIVELGRDAETADTAREARRALGQRIDLDLDAGSLYLLLHLDIAGTAVKEGLKGIDGTVLLDDDAVERDAGDLELARYLREHDVLRPGHRTVGTTVDVLYLKALLLRQRDFLRMEAVEFGHLSFQLRQVHQRIYFIGQQYRLLLIDPLFVGTDLDEEVGTRDGRTGCTRLGRHLLLTLSSPTLSGLRLTRDGNLQRAGRHGLSLGSNVSCRKGERAVLHSHDNIGKGNRRRLAGVAVDNLETGLRRAAGAHQHLEGVGQVAHTEVADILGVDRVRQTELLAHRHVRRGIGGQRLSNSLDRHEQKKQSPPTPSPREGCLNTRLAGLIDTCI